MDKFQLKIKKVFFKLPIILLSVNGIVYAAQNNFNPYAAFNAQGSSVSSSGSGNSAQPTTVPAANSNKPIQYVQPASQVGKFAAPAPLVKFTQSSPVQANNKNPNNQVQPTSNNLTPGSNGINNSAAPSGLSPSGLAPITPVGPALPSGFPIQGISILEQILTNTASINTAAQSIQGIDQQLSSYWMTPPTTQNYQNLQNISGYSALSGLNTTFTSAASLQQNLSNSTGFASLVGNWAQANPSPNTLSGGATNGNNGSTSNLTSNLPYLGSLTQGNMQNPETDPLWIPAVNTALYNLSMNQTNMSTLGQVVNMPFGGQTSWATTIQSMPTPQLLQVLVIEQAIGNELSYQILQRQQDQELMQASELAMLATIYNNLQLGMAEQIRQETRIVNAIYNSKSGQ